MGSKVFCNPLELKLNSLRVIVPSRNFLLIKIKLKTNKTFCQPDVSFFPLIKVNPQFFIKGISSNTPLIQRIYRALLPPYASLYLYELVSLFFSLHLVTCTYCRPLSKGLGLQVCMHTFEVKKKIKNSNQFKERGEH